MERTRVLGDIGGTNARFAWQAGAGHPLEQMMTLPVAGYVSLEAAFRDYLSRTGRAMPRDASIAMANPVLGDQGRMTNHDWEFSIAAMQASLGLERLVILNDFTAVALSLPALAAGDLRQVGSGTAAPEKPRAVIGPGTGLGVSGLLPNGRGDWIPIEGEGGHVTLAACSAKERDVVAWLENRYGHSSAERAVSGPGLADLYCASAA